MIDFVRGADSDDEFPMLNFPCWISERESVRICSRSVRIRSEYTSSVHKVGTHSVLSNINLALLTLWWRVSSSLKLFTILKVSLPTYSQSFISKLLFQATLPSFSPFFNPLTSSFVGSIRIPSKDALSYADLFVKKVLMNFELLSFLSLNLTQGNRMFCKGKLIEKFFRLFPPRERFL